MMLPNMSQPSCALICLGPTEALVKFRFSVAKVLRDMGVYLSDFMPFSMFLLLCYPKENVP